jgi:hypothetical protein
VTLKYANTPTINSRVLADALLWANVGFKGKGGLSVISRGVEAVIVVENATGR